MSAAARTQESMLSYHLIHTWYQVCCGRGAKGFFGLLIRGILPNTSTKKMKLSKLRMKPDGLTHGLGIQKAVSQTQNMVSMMVGSGTPSFIKIT